MELLTIGLNWSTFLKVLLLFGAAPRTMMRIIVLAWSPDSGRREELLAELAIVEYWKRPLWVVEQLESAVFDGIPDRLRARERRQRRPGLVILVQRAGTVILVRAAENYVRVGVTVLVVGGGVVGFLAWPGGRPNVPTLPRLSGPTAAPPTVVATAQVAALPVFDANQAMPTGQALSVTLSNPTPIGAALVLYVTEQQADWLRVKLPTGGGTGWVRRQDVSLSTTPFRIQVEHGAHRLTVRDEQTVILEAPVAVGRDASVVDGSYYITGLVEPTDALGHPPSDSFYGPYAYELSSNTQDRIAIRGTNNPSSLGTDVEGCCLTISDDTIRKLAELLPLGTPVEIIA